MADVAAGNEVNHVFGDVRGVIANAFKIFRDENQLKSREDDRRIFHHVGKQFAKELVAKTIDLIVALEHAAGEIDIRADQGIQTIPDHSFGKFAHARQVNVGFYLRMAKNTHRRLRDVDGLIADTFEITVDARNCQEEAEVGGHGL